MADTLTSTASEEVAAAKPEKKVSGRRVIFASAFGNALEFFDFGGVQLLRGVYRGTVFPSDQRS